MDERDPRITFLDNWSYFDALEKKLGWLGLLGNIELFGTAQWAVHYRLNGMVAPQ